MSFTNQDFSVMAYANGFTLWTYNTEDVLADIKKTNYFNDIATFARAGDMVLVTANREAKVTPAILAVTKINNGIVDVVNLTS